MWKLKIKQGILLHQRIDKFAGSKLLFCCRGWHVCICVESWNQKEFTLLTQEWRQARRDCTRTIAQLETTCQYQIEYSMLNGLALQRVVESISPKPSAKLGTLRKKDGRYRSRVALVSRTFLEIIKYRLRAPGDTTFHQDVPNWLICLNWATYSSCKVPRFF